MNRVHHHSRALRWHRRQGLAPLELTLALPMLVIMMALMIDFGVVGAWKVRTQTNARYAAWRTVNARTGEHNPTPPYWSASAPLTTQTGPDLDDAATLWNSQQDLLCPCVRGNQLSAPSAPNTVNVPGRLDVDGFVLQGNAQLERPLPLLRSAVRGGQFRFNLTQDIFDNQWQFYSLGIPWNNHLRALTWWDIEHSDLAARDGAIDSNLRNLEQGSMQLQSSPQRQDLYPLDNDDEHIRYYGWPAPDFYPRLSRACMSEPEQVYASLVSRLDLDGQPNPRSLLGRIDRLPCDMSRRFTGMYRSWICELEMCGSTADDSGLRARFNDLRQFMQAQNCSGVPGPLTRCNCPPRQTCPCPPSPVGVGR